MNSQDILSKKKHYIKKGKEIVLFVRSQNKGNIQRHLKFEIVCVFNSVGHLLQDVIRNGLYDGSMRHREKLCLVNDYHEKRAV